MIQLKQHQVHVWQLSFDELRGHQAELAAYLTPEEAARSHQFKRPNDMSNYQLCRGALRRILSLYLDQQPAELLIDSTEIGKPFVPHSAIHFNVSHAGGYALIAVSCAEVGVDIEHSERHRDMLPIAERFFTWNEYLAIKAQASDCLQPYACQLWCCKEAFVKAIGQGIAFGLDKFDIELTEGEARIVSVANANYEAKDWTMLLLDAPVGYLAALAIQLKRVELSFFDAKSYLY